MATIYDSTRHAKFSINYHFVWTPKYRKKVLDNPAIVEFIKENIHTMQTDYDFTVIALEVMSEHIHLQLKTIPKNSPANLINKIKGNLGLRIVKRFPETKGKGVWSNSYFCATTGDVSTETIKKYIENQWDKIRILE